MTAPTSPQQKTRQARHFAGSRPTFNNLAVSGCDGEPDTNPTSPADDPTRPQRRVYDTLPGSDLTTEDLQHLADSWIMPELARQAGLYRVESYQGASIVGRKDDSAGRGKYSGIVFPNVLPGQDRTRGHRLKLDLPEYKQGTDGNPKPSRKYLTAPGSRNQLYFAPGTPVEQLSDPLLPVAITEGEKKTLALYRLAHQDIESPRFLAVGVTGVWNWKGVVSKGNGPRGERISLKGVIPDLDKINWTDRKVYIVFDSDCRTNESVQWARRSLARELARRGAQMLLVDVPEVAE